MAGVCLCACGGGSTSADLFAGGDPLADSGGLNPDATSGPTGDAQGSDVTARDGTTDPFDALTRDGGSGSDAVVGDAVSGGPDALGGDAVSGGPDALGGDAGSGGSDALVSTDVSTPETSTGTVHPAGWLARGSGTFHGDIANTGLAACTACHGADLSGGVSNVSCNNCHAGWQSQCTFCHGGKDNQTGAPPRDVAKREAPSEVTVGAHTSHVMATHGLSAAMGCDACHVKPTDALSPGHIDPSPAELSFGSLAKTGGATPTWTAAGATCSNTYCHGKFTGGDSANRPVWTSVGASGPQCGSCHAISPRTGRHPSNFSKHSFMGQDCTHCHDGMTDAQGASITSPALHVNGVKDVKLRQGGTWSGGRCAPACHESERW